MGKGEAVICAGGRVEIRVGDCRDLLREMPDESVESVVTDPPYGFEFMGHSWDRAAPAKEIWAECLRVLKPGGHLLAFGGTRTYHRLAVSIEDAGFEIRDQIGWTYGSGFPKSMDPNKKDPRCPEGYGTVLKPAWEPICLARKPLDGTVAANVLKHGTGALNIDGCRVATADGYSENRVTQGVNTAQTSYDWRPERMTFAPSKLGRWPANLVHDGSPEVVAGFPDSDVQAGAVTGNEASQPFGGHIYGEMKGRLAASPRGDSGSAARFFYCAKASRSERGRFNTHPTVKPVALMQWLVRLVTPPGGTVLDPFSGSGTTGIAAAREGFRAILMEQSEEYARIAERRIQEEWREPVKADDAPEDLGPLFGGAPQ